MKIEIGRYTLRSDRHCMWLEEECVSKETGKKYTRRAAGYATNLEMLFRQFAEHNYRNDDVETVKDLLKAFAQTEKDLKEIKSAALKEDFKIIRRIAKEKGVK